MVDVVEGGFDVVFRIGRLTDSGLVARRLATDRLVVCASPEYLARAGTPRVPADLHQHVCLHYALVSRAAEWRFRQGGRAIEVSTRGPLTCTDGLSLREAVLAGAGLAAVPSMLVADDVAAGRLQLVLEGARRAEFGLHAVTAHRTQVPPRVRALLDFLVPTSASAAPGSSRSSRRDGDVSSAGRLRLDGGQVPEHRPRLGTGTSDRARSTGTDVPVGALRGSSDSVRVPAPCRGALTDHVSSRSTSHDGGFSVRSSW